MAKERTADGEYVIHIGANGPQNLPGVSHSIFTGTSLPRPKSGVHVLDCTSFVPTLRRPEDYSPEQGARFEVHFEKLRNRVDGVVSRIFRTFDQATASVGMTCG